MLRSAIGFAFRRPASAPRFPGSNGGRGGPGCSHTARRNMCSRGMDGSDSERVDDFKRVMAYFYENWKGPEMLFGCIAATLMITYKYNVRGKTILGYRPEVARKEREARKQREKLEKNNIDISLC